jgi:DNA-binding NtrC family response regulator
VGIDPHAFARFVEYPFEGEERELEMLVQLLVVYASSDTICVADVEHVLARHGSPSSGTWSDAR